MNCRTWGIKYVRIVEKEDTEDFWRAAAIFVAGVGMATAQGGVVGEDAGVPTGGGPWGGVRAGT